jgi:hypothetical protein
MFSGIHTDNTRPLGFFFKGEPVSSKLRTHVQKELDCGAESHSQLQIFPFLCATLYMPLSQTLKLAVALVRCYCVPASNALLCLTAEVHGDDELAIVDAEVLTVDPITKQTMTDPVRIKQCGHTFERKSIMSLLKNRRHIK